MGLATMRCSSAASASIIESTFTIVDHGGLGVALGA
jgi:hypothetical protein